jgi:hypothetical protein
LRGAEPLPTEAPLRSSPLRRLATNRHGHPGLDKRWRGSRCSASFSNMKRTFFSRNYRVSPSIALNLIRLAANCSWCNSGHPLHAASPPASFMAKARQVASPHSAQFFPGRSLKRSRARGALLEAILGEIRSLLASVSFMMCISSSVTFFASSSSSSLVMAICRGRKVIRWPPRFTVRIRSAWLYSPGLSVVLRYGNR